MFLQFLSRYQLDFDENAGSNGSKWIRLELQVLHTVFENSALKLWPNRQLQILG